MMHCVLSGPMPMQFIRITWQSVCSRLPYFKPPAQVKDKERGRSGSGAARGSGRQGKLTRGETRSASIIIVCYSYSYSLSIVARLCRFSVV